MTTTTAENHPELKRMFTEVIQQHVTSVTSTLKTTHANNMANFRKNAELLSNTNNKVTQTQQDIEGLTAKLHTLEHQLELTTNTANTNYENTQRLKRTNEEMSKHIQILENKHQKILTYANTLPTT